MLRFVGLAVLAFSLSACNGTTDPDDGILSYDGSLSVKSEAPIVVGGEVPVRNTSESVVTIERNACPYEINLHWWASSNSAPAWQNEPMVCLGVSMPLDLSPGSSYTFSFQANIPSNLKDGLYYLAVVNNQWRDGRQIMLGNIEIVGGKARK